MIKELKLENWKSFKAGTLFIDPLTILIGTNSSGKSNALDALLFLQRVSSGIGIFQTINGEMNLPGLRGGIEWVCLKPETQFSLSVLAGGENEKQDYRYDLTVQVNGTKAEVHEEKLTSITHRMRSEAKEKQLFYTKQGEPGSPALPAYFNTGSPGHGRRIDLSRTHTILSQTETLKLRKEVHEASRWLLRLLRGIFVFEPIPNLMRDYTPMAEQLHANGANISGVLAGLEVARKKEVEASLTHYLKSLPEQDINRVWTETVGKFGNDAMLYCEERWGKDASDTIDARGMSDGTLRFLAIITALLTREPGSLLVIEEVDNGLHPSRGQLLIEMLQQLGAERNIDVLVTTHNPALLDAAGPVMIPFTIAAHRSGSRGTSQLTPIEDLDHLAKLLAMGNLGKLSTEGHLEKALKRVACQ